MEPVLRQRPCAPGRDVPARLRSRRRSCRSPSSTSWCRRYRARPSQSRAGPHHRPRRRVGHDRAARHGAERDGDRRAALHHRAVKTVFALTSFAARATDPSGSRAPLAASQMATESLLLLSVNRIVTEVDAPVQPTAGGRLRRGAGDVSGAGSGGARATPDRPCEPPRASPLVCPPSLCCVTGAGNKGRVCPGAPRSCPGVGSVHPADRH